MKRLRDHTGTSLVEAALIMPLMFLLTFAMVDFGVLFYAYLALENGVSQATRYSITGSKAPGLSREESIKKVMRDETPTLTITDSAFAFSHLKPGGTWQSGVGDPSDVQKVTVTYAWTFMTPLIRPFFTDGQLVLKVESAMRNEPRFN
jgi:Flp pilus assembly protein TadG